MKRIEAATRDLGNRLGRTPTTAEVVAETGISMQHWGQSRLTETAQAMALDRNESSPVSASDLRADEASTDAVVAREELRSALASAIKSLPCRDRQIVALYHWRGVTMREIGRLFNINESRVSQIHKRALERLAATLRSSGITSSSSILLR